MAKKPAADIDALVTAALAALAVADAPLRLAGKGDPPALFPSKGAGEKAAIDRLTVGPDPLVGVEKVGKVETARLTATGFRRVAPQLPDEQVGAAAKRFAAALPAAERVAFLQEIVSRTPTAAAELLPELEAAVAAEKADAEARIAAAARRREREETSRVALARWLALLDTQQQQRRDTLRREYEAEGGRAEDLPPPAAPTPTTPEEHGFRREVIRRLAAAWREAFDLGRDEPARFLEAGIGNVRGVRQLEAAGDSVRFDGEVHECDDGVPTGAAVRVVRPGWAIDEADDRRVVVLKARVAR